MAELERVRGLASKTARTLAPGPMRRRDERREAGERQAETIAELAARVAALEQDMIESRRLNSRLAELIDVVEQMLVPLARHDDGAVEAALSHFTAVFPPPKTDSEA